MIKQKRGMVMIFALVVLLALTLLGIAALGSSTLQQKMAVNSQQQALLFNAAEAALAGVMFESEDEQLLADDTLLDPISEARQGDSLDPISQAFSCFIEQGFPSRTVTSAGFSPGTKHQLSGTQDSQNRLLSWSRIAFVREQACRGSSNVIGGSHIRCHVFIIRGCGQLIGSDYAVANTMTAAVFAPVSQ